MRDTSASPRTSRRSTSIEGIAAEDKALALNAGVLRSAQLQEHPAAPPGEHREGPGQAESSCSRRPTSSASKALEIQKKQNAGGAAAAPKGKGRRVSPLPTGDCANGLRPSGRRLRATALCVCGASASAIRAHEAVADYRPVASPGHRLARASDDAFIGAPGGAACSSALRRRADARSAASRATELASPWARQRKRARLAMSGARRVCTSAAGRLLPGRAPGFFAHAVGDDADLGHAGAHRGVDDGHDFAVADRRRRQ